MNLPESNFVYQRQYLPDRFRIKDWDTVRPYFEELKKRPINSVEELEEWITHKNELETIISEENKWRFIHLSQNANDADIEDAYSFFIEAIVPKVTAAKHKLNQKLLDSPYLKELDQEKYFTFLRELKTKFKLFREENLELFKEEKVHSKEFGRISSEMTIEVNGKEQTLQQANNLLLEQDRNLRETTFRAISSRRLQDAEKLDDLFDLLLEKRQKIAENAGFDNYRDYKFAELGRFDYTPEDCFSFHDAIAKEVVPLLNEFNLDRQKRLNLDTLRPWDMSVDPDHASPIFPFENGKELIQKSIDALNRTHPYFAECLAIMNAKEHLDLDSRKGKRPGGYNMPLPIAGVPFIFMNAANSLRDVRVIMHEIGHAVHFFLTRELLLPTHRNPPSEVAELAAMSMEFLSLPRWNNFFDSEETFRRAQLWQLEKAISIIPWVATIDKFQHWVYTNVGHTRAERDQAWTEIFHQFESSVINWEGLEGFQAKFWHRQLHLFEAPFYYIEYGMAQLGALAIYRQHCQSPEEATQNYINALQIGYQKPIGDIYEKAGIQFDFSQSYVNDIAHFVREEIGRLRASKA